MPFISTRIINLGFVAGVAALALTTSIGRADIVYTDPVDIHLPWAAGLPAPQPVPIDLDLDGDPEFALRWEGLVGIGIGWFAYLTANGLDETILSHEPPIPGVAFAYAQGFATGELVGPSSSPNTSPYASLGEFFWEDRPPYSFFYHGDWADPTRLRILSAGLAFDLNGQQHFGWARIAMNTQGITLMDYAYESTPGASLPAGVPAPPCLALLAIGTLVKRRQR